MQRNGGELARRAERDVGGLGRDDEAGDGTADLGLKQLVEWAIALARCQQHIEISDLAPARHLGCRWRLGRGRLRLRLACGLWRSVQVDRPAAVAVNAL